MKNKRFTTDTILRVRSPQSIAIGIDVALDACYSTIQNVLGEVIPLDDMLRWNRNPRQQKELKSKYARVDAQIKVLKKDLFELSLKHKIRSRYLS